MILTLCAFLKLDRNILNYFSIIIKGRHVQNKSFPVVSSCNQFSCNCSRHNTSQHVCQTHQAPIRRSQTRNQTSKLKSSCIRKTGKRDALERSCAVRRTHVTQTQTSDGEGKRNRTKQRQLQSRNPSGCRAVHSRFDSAQSCTSFILAAHK